MKTGRGIAASDINKNSGYFIELVMLDITCLLAGDSIME
jgi:hypothetical protein